MKKLALAALAATMLTGTAYAGGNDLPGVRAALNSISPVVNESVGRAEQLFTQNNGGASFVQMGAVEDVLGAGHKTLSDVQIDINYYIHFTFYSSRGATDVSTNSVTMYVPKTLVSKKIILVPNYVAGDEAISTWTCITDADEGLAMYSGDAGTTADSASRVLQYSLNPYLDGCVYIANTNLPAIATGD